MMLIPSITKTPLNPRLHMILSRQKFESFKYIALLLLPVLTICLAMSSHNTLSTAEWATAFIFPSPDKLMCSTTFNFSSEQSHRTWAKWGQVIWQNLKCVICSPVPGTVLISSCNAIGPIFTFWIPTMIFVFWALTKIIHWTLLTIFKAFCSSFLQNFSNFPH